MNELETHFSKAHRRKAMTAFPPGKIKAVFFDANGTLFDDQHIVKKAVSQAAAKYGYHEVEENWQELKAKTIIGQLEWIKERCPDFPTDRDKFPAFAKAIYVENIQHVFARADIEAALDLIDAAKIRWTVFSNAPRKVLDAAVGATGFAQRKIKPVFVMSAKEDTGHDKSVPESYQAALSHMNELLGEDLQPDEVLFIDDSLESVEGALKANMRVIHYRLSSEEPTSNDPRCLPVDTAENLVATMRIALGATNQPQHKTARKHKL